MKKFVMFLLIAAVFAAIMFIPSMAHAQDSAATISGGGSDVDFFNFLFNFIPAKWKGDVITVLTGLFLFEQFLANTQKVAANSTFQLVAKWISALFKSIGTKK